MIPPDTSLLRRMPTPRSCLLPRTVTSSEMSLAAPVQHISDTPSIASQMECVHLSDHLCQLSGAEQCSHVPCSYTGVMLGCEDATYPNPNFLAAFIWALHTAVDAPSTWVVGTACHNCFLREAGGFVCNFFVSFLLQCMFLPERATSPLQNSGASWEIVVYISEVFFS